jgi:uncharacterized membrane protein
VCSFWCCFCLRIGCECLDGLLGFIFVGLIVVNILGYIKLGLSILLECFFCLFVFWNAKSYSSKKKKKKNGEGTGFVIKTG